MKKEEQKSLSRDMEMFLKYLKRGICCELCQRKVLSKEQMQKLWEMHK